MYKDGHSTIKIAGLLGVTDHTIATRLRDNGVEIRPSNRPKFTNKSFTAKLLASGAKCTPLEPYVHNGSKILFKCNVCSNEWRTTPYRILHGMGCPICSVLKSITSCRKKSYTLGDRQVQVQGSEPHALDHIIKHLGIKPELIRVNITDTSQVPIISYFFNGKVRKHYPDIYIPTLNRIYEVKSTQSLGLLITNFKKSKIGVLLDENKAKFVEGNKAGYDYRFLVHHRGVIIHLPEEWVDLQREELLAVCDDISRKSKTQLKQAI